MMTSYIIVNNGTDMVYTVRCVLIASVSDTVCLCFHGRTLSPGQHIEHVCVGCSSDLPRGPCPFLMKKCTHRVRPLLTTRYILYHHCTVVRIQLCGFGLDILRQCSCPVAVPQDRQFRYRPVLGLR